MTCRNPASFLSGFSQEACDRVHGTWCRNSCDKLKKCIENKPSVGEPGYSEAFDEFTADLNITDAKEEEQCRTARELLGFDSDYSDDNEICRQFERLKCDSFFGDIDGFRSGKTTSFPDFDFEPFDVDLDLPFQEIRRTPMTETPDCK